MKKEQQGADMPDDYDDDTDCWNCGGDGWIEGQCTCMEDCCACLEPDAPRCGVCHGKGVL